MILKSGDGRIPALHDMSPSACEHLSLTLGNLDACRIFPTRWRALRRLPLARLNSMQECRMRLAPNEFATCLMGAAQAGEYR